MSRKIKKIIEDKLLNKLNNIVIWTYINCNDSIYKVISKSVDLIVVILEKTNYINKRK